MSRRRRRRRTPTRTAVSRWSTLAQGAEAAAESVATHRLRSALTLLGVLVGVLSVLAIAAYGQYANAQVTRLLAEFGSNLVVVTPGAPPTSGARIGVANTLTVDDATAIQQQVPELVATSGVKGGSITAISARSSWSTQVLGVSPTFPMIEGLQLAAGSFFSDADARSTASVAVLGTEAAAQLFPGGDATGQWLRLGSTVFHVSGVLAPRGQTVNGNLDDVIYVPLTTALRRLYGGTSLDRIELRVAQREQIGQCIARITALLAERHHIRPGYPTDLQVQNDQQVADSAARATQSIALGLEAAAVLALAIAGFGLMNIMLVSVSERTPEIGVRLAVGARTSDVRAQFLAEAVTLCLGGALLGTLVGLAAAALASQRLGMGVMPPVGAILLAGCISASIGLVFGLYPAERAARLDPIVALRAE